MAYNLDMLKNSDYLNNPYNTTEPSVPEFPTSGNTVGGNATQPGGTWAENQAGQTGYTPYGDNELQSYFSNSNPIASLPGDQVSGSSQILPASNESTSGGWTPNEEGRYIPYQGSDLNNQFNSSFMMDPGPVDEVNTSSTILPPPPGQEPAQQPVNNEAPVQEEGQNSIYEEFGNNNPEDPHDDGQMDLTKQDNITDHGNLYDDNVYKALNGESADVQSARNLADRDNKFQTYYDEKSVKESLAAAGIQPGTAEYQRALDRARAQTNSANLNRDNSVNELQRNYYNDAMGMASGVEDKHYNKASEAYYDKKGDDLKNEQNFMSWLNKQPLKIQNILNPLVVSGGDYMGAMQKMYDNGEITDPYKPADDNQALMDNAKSYYEQLFPSDKNDWNTTMVDHDSNPNTPEMSINDAIQERYKQLDRNELNPLNDADYETERVQGERSLEEAIKNGDPITEQMVIDGKDLLYDDNIPTSLVDINPGEYMNISGKAIKIVGEGTYDRQDGDRTNEYVKIEYPINSGTFYYKDNGGGSDGSGVSQWFSEEPKEDADISDYRITNPLEEGGGQPVESTSSSSTSGVGYLGTSFGF